MKKILALLLFSVVVFGATAQWHVIGYDADMNSIITRDVKVDYTGQNITLSAVKTATASAYSLTYTGSDTTVAGETYYGIQAKNVWGVDVVWVRLSNSVVVRY